MQTPNQNNRKQKARITFLFGGTLLIVIAIISPGLFPKEPMQQESSHIPESQCVNGSDDMNVISTFTSNEETDEQQDIKMDERAFFVSPEGDDNNPGTLAEPWKTLNKAASDAIAGDVVFIRKGVYHEATRFENSGTDVEPIKILAYPGENPVIDGENTIPGIGGYLMEIKGNHIQLSGLEVKNSAYGGIYIYGDYDIINKVNVHHNRVIGIIISHGKYSVVENSLIWRNSISNEFEADTTWGAGVSAGRDGVSYATIRNNIVWENWGEGISTGESNHVVIENNISHDNYSANIYILDAENVVCQRNFVYMSTCSYVYGYGSNVGIMLGDEQYTPPSQNIQVINNIAFGNHRNFFWWQGVQGGGMDNVLIANNTFVNGTGDATIGQGGVTVGKGTHANVLFINNIVVQDNETPEIATIEQEGVTYKNNLWSKPPINAAKSSSDIIGDPKFTKGASIFSVDWYKLSDKSIAINMGIPLEQVLTDLLGMQRVNKPDLGALEIR